MSRSTKCALKLSYDADWYLLDWYWWVLSFPRKYFVSTLTSLYIETKHSQVCPKSPRNIRQVINLPKTYVMILVDAVFNLYYYISSTTFSKLILFDIRLASFSSYYNFQYFVWLLFTSIFWFIELFAVPFTPPSAKNVQKIQSVLKKHVIMLVDTLLLFFAWLYWCWQVSSFLRAVADSPRNWIFELKFEIQSWNINPSKLIKRIE